MHISITLQPASTPRRTIELFVMKKPRVFAVGTPRNLLHSERGKNLVLKSIILMREWAGVVNNRIRVARLCTLCRARRAVRVFCNSGYKTVIIQNRSNLIITQMHAFVINFGASLNPLYIYPE